MADFYFFTDVDLITQDSGEHFGEISSSEYRIADYFKRTLGKTETPRVFAICSGTIYARPNASDSSNLIDLILKPSTQPRELNKSFQQKIKYIIYKGVQKSSLIAENSSIAAYSANELTSKLHDGQKRLNVAEGLQPDEVTPSAEILKYTTNFDSDDNLDKLFYNFSSSFLVSNVAAGEHIGDFSPDRFGLQIILDDPGNKVDFSVFSDMDSKIKIEITDTNFDRKLKKEKVLGFMDCAAFYSGLTPAKVCYRESLDSEEIKKVTSGNEITTILLNNFKNKNRVYIDVRDEFGKSVNFFQEYNSPTFKVNLSDKSSSPSIISSNYFDSNGWPIIAIDHISSEGSALYKMQDPTSSKCSIELSFPYDNSVNSYPTCYLSSGYFYPTDSSKALTNTVHIDAIKSLKPGDITATHTSSVFIGVHQMPGESVIFPLANYHRLKYINGKSLSYNDTISDQRKTFKLDNIFNLRILEKRSEISEGTFQSEIRIFDNGPYVQYSDRDTKDQFDKDFFSTSGFAADQNSTVLFAFLKDRKSEYKNQNLIDISNAFDNTTNAISLLRSLEHNFANRDYDSDLQVQELNLISEGGDTTNVLKFVDKGFKGSTKGSTGMPIPKNLKEEFVGIVLKNSTIDQLISNSGFDINSDIFVQFDAIAGINIPAASGGTATPYAKFRIKLFGFRNVGGEFQADTWIPSGSSDEVFVYGLHNLKYNASPMILVEKGMDIDITPPKIEYTQCELLKKTDFNKRLYDFVERLKAGSDRIIDGLLAPHYHSKRIYEGVFEFYGEISSAPPSSESKIQVWKEIGGINNGDYHIELPTNSSSISSGFLVEACLSYTLWNYYIQMSSIDFLSTKLWSVIKKCLLDSGFREPEDSLTELKLAEFIMGHPNIYGQQNVGNGIYSSHGLSSELYDWIEVGGNTYIPPKSSKIKSLGVSAITKFYNRFYNEAFRVAGLEVTCLYQYLSGLDYVPEALVMSAGEGSGSSTFFGIDNSSIALIFFKYAFEGVNGAPLASNTQVFQNTDYGAFSSVLHINFMGLDGGDDSSLRGYEDRKVIVELDGDHRIEFKIDDRQGKRFMEAIDSYSESDPNGTNIEFSGTELTADSEITFYYNNPISNEKIVFATFDPQRMDIFFPNAKSNSVFNVTLQSGYRVTVIDPYDEISLFVCVTPGKPRNELELEDYFIDDVFEIPNTDKDIFIDSKEEKDVFEDFIEKIKNGQITSGNINIDLNAGFIGMVGTGPTGSVISDPGYLFDTNPPEISEVGSLANAIGSPLRYTYGTVSIQENSARINISSYVSPLWSRLDEKILDYDTRGTQAERDLRKANLDALTSYGLDSSSAAYVTLPDSTVIPSYNGLLSAMRCYALLDSIWYCAYKTAEDLGYSNTDKTNILNTIGQAIQSTSIDSDPQKGISSNITFNDFKSLKWYDTRGLNATEIENLINLYSWHPEDI